MATASLIAEFGKVRCGGCKITLPDEMALSCPVCGAVFDRISSNHVGLADALRKKRGDMGPPVFKAISARLLERIVQTLQTNGADPSHIAESLQTVLENAPEVNDTLSDEQLSAAAEANRKAAETVAPG